MPTDASFRRLVLGAMGGLLAITLGCSVLLYHTGPRPRTLSYDAVQAPTIATLTFDRPLQAGQPVSKLVRMSPQLPFTVSLQANQVTLRFSQRLASNTLYTVRILPGLRDVEGRPSQRTFAQQIMTQPARYVFLRRTYQCARQPCQDKIIERTVGSSHEHILAHAPRIKTFDYTHNYLAILHSIDKKHDQLTVENLHTHRIAVVPLPASEKMSEMHLSPTLPIVSFFGYTPHYETVLTNYLLNQNRAVQVKPPGKNNGATGFIYSHDGRTLLYQAYTQGYYATDPSSTHPTSTFLGTFITTGGFSTDDTKILFQGSELYTFVYDASSKTSTQLSVPTDVASLHFTALGNAVLSQTFGSQKGDMIALTKPGYAKPTRTYQLSLSAQSFSPSPDDHYFLLQVETPGNDGLDDAAGYDTFAQPKNASIALYDTTTGMVTTHIAGCQPQWE